MATQISFNGFNLQTGQIITSDIQHDDAPDRHLYSAETVRGRGSKLSAAYYTQKPIKIIGTIMGTTVSGCDALIDLFRMNIAPFQSNLDIGFAGSTRRYLATASKPAIKRPSPVATYADFEVDFMVADAYAVDTGLTTLMSGTTTSGGSTINQAVTFSGTAQEQAPAFTVTLISGGGLTSNKSMAITNSAVGLGITVTRNWTAGDVVVIDCTTKTVLVNGVLNDYSGTFPTWVPGAGTVQYTDNFTSRKINVSATYTKLWL